MSTIAEISEESVWTLAGRADLVMPDTLESPGAKFLSRIRDDVLERAENGSLDEDALHEVADFAVPIYTHERWQTFVDLAAYHEDIEELGEPQADMTANAATALYLIASRLANSLFEDLDLADDNSEGDGDEETDSGPQE